MGATEQVAGQVATAAEAPCTQVRMLPAMLCGQDAAAEHPVPIAVAGTSLRELEAVSTVSMVQTGAS